jgi:chemosensory pili system protein ChpE
MCLEALVIGREALGNAPGRILSRAFNFLPKSGVTTIRYLEDKVHFDIIFLGIMMGLAFAAPPGAIAAETIRRGAAGGFAAAFSVQLGSLVGDAAYALLALAGVVALAQNPKLQIGLGAFGSVFLLYLAWSSFKTARKAAPIIQFSSIKSGRNDYHGDAFLSGLIISLANPWAIAFWLSLGGALAAFGVINASGFVILIFFSSFMLGSVLWGMLISLAITRVRVLLSPTLLKIVSIICGVLLGAFGLITASQVILIVRGI